MLRDLDRVVFYFLYPFLFLFFLQGFLTQDLTQAMLLLLHLFSSFHRFPNRLHGIPLSALAVLILPACFPSFLFIYTQIGLKYKTRFFLGIFPFKYFCFTYRIVTKRLFFIFLFLNKTNNSTGTDGHAPFGRMPYSANEDPSLHFVQA